MRSFANAFTRTSLIALFAIVGVFMTACSGGGGSGSSPLPSQGGAQPKSTIHKVTVVSKASIPSVMAKLIQHGAFYSPRKGVPVPLLKNLRSPQSINAGYDLSNYGGPVQSGANEYNILVNCNDESCWGGLISGFQNNLFASTMMNSDILPQYNAAGTYAFAGDYPASYNTSAQLQDSDIFNILYSVITANALPTGYGSEFHVFLGQGVEECSSSAGGCYSPSNPSTWAFCAYHGSNDWSDIGHVLYSVEPYQDVSGCQVSTLPSPNGSLVDSTASTLSHETFETITDPDVGINNLGWYNSSKGEIGDLCAPGGGVSTGNVNLNGATYEIQMEYNNSVHDCSY